MVRGLKWFSFMTVAVVGVLCFIELSIRRKSGWIRRAFRFIEQQMFHSKHHKEVQDRRKQKDKDSMNVFRSISTMSLQRERSGTGPTGELQSFGDRNRASLSSKTLPAIGLWERMQLRSLQSERESESEQRQSIDTPPRQSLSRSRSNVNDRNRSPSLL